MNPNELSQNILSAMAKGHAYDQLVTQQKDQRIAQLERELADLKRQIAAKAAPLEVVSGGAVSDTAAAE